MQLSTQRSTVEMAGIPISRMTQSETVRQLVRWMGSSGAHHVATANVDFFHVASHDPEFRDALDHCDLVTADGAPLLWVARVLGSRIPERVAGSDLALPLLKATAKAGKTAYLLGGTAEVLECLHRKLEAELPDLEIAGMDSSIVNLNDQVGTERIVERIRASGASLLLVGLGCPKQEMFLRDYLARTGCKVGIGVGGTFNFLTGTVRRAPRWLQRMGLEWAFRLAVEPRRLWRRYVRDFVALGPLLGSALYQNGMWWRESRA